MAGVLNPRWQHPLPDGRIQCDLCPRDCKLHKGQRGACFVRQHTGTQIELVAYGRSSGFCIDPIEKKPLNHFYPGTAVLSFGTEGCNLACKFCQNWDISKSRETATLSSAASPADIARAAQEQGAPAVAFTYNDPVIFAEYALDTAAACHELGIRTVAVSAGYISDSARAEFFAGMDAANIDLKSFSEDFYARLCGGHLQPVLDTLLYLRHETPVWLEITTLLIPGENDSPKDVTALCRWIADELGPDVPLHFTAFHPAWKMNDHPATRAATLTMARRIAQEIGLHFVYLGNLAIADGGTTFCPCCGSKLIERLGYTIGTYRLDAQGACPDCGTAMPGHWAPEPGHFGTRRQPIQF